MAEELRKLERDRLTHSESAAARQEPGIGRGSLG